MSVKTSQSATEADLESAISAAIARAFPRLVGPDISHQVEFSIRLGHATITTKGRESWVRRGRADVLLTHKGRPLAIVELKKSGVALQTGDGEQGLSYARLLPEMAPFVIVTNGHDLQILEAFSGKSWTAETPDEKAFEGLLSSAAKVAACDREAAIETLMSSDPQVWTRATAAASQAAVAELTASPDHPLLPFGPLKIPRQATIEVARKLSAGARLVLVSGAPLAGKTNVLEQLTRIVNPELAGALFVDGSTREVFRRIADLLTDALDWQIDPEQARAWVRRVSRAGNQPLILAIDRLDSEDREDVGMIEDLTSSAFGPALKIVVGVDEDAARRLQVSADGRRESAIGRRAALVEVEELSDPEFRDALDALLKLGMGVMEGGQHSADLRQPWLLQAFTTRLSGIKSSGIGVFPAVPGLEIIGQARSNFTDPELRRRYRDLAEAVVKEAQDQFKPFVFALLLTGRYFVRRETLDAAVKPADIDWLMKQGYLTPSIGHDAIPIVTIALPELLASELARRLADDLRIMAKEDAKQAAEWLAGAASNFLFGDIIAAQAVLDVGSGNGRIPFALYDALVDMTPVREAAHAGQHLLAWVDEVGSVEIRPQADGTSVVTIGGQDHTIDDMGSEGGVYANIHGWLILARLASRRFVVEVDGRVNRLDPEALLMVGTADFVLRQPRNNFLMDSLPTHDTPGGGQFVCHRAGVVEAVTQSILKYLNTEPIADRDAFIATAIQLDSVYLTARIDIALRTLARSADEETAAWAQKVLAEIVRPAFVRYIPDH